jgi:hypothetical protein
VLSQVKMASCDNPLAGDGQQTTGPLKQMQSSKGDFVSG